MTPEVWFAIPSANAIQAALTIPRWRAQGYKVALLFDRYEHRVEADLVVRQWTDWRGWVASVRYLTRVVLADKPLIVTGGDDMYPDPTRTAAEVAEMFFSRFPDGMGVLQPTGDDLEGTDRICGSPFLGRAWLDRSYQGLGPFFGGYFSYYADEELLHVSRALGCLWQCPDLAHRHDHYTRRGLPVPRYLKASHAKFGHDQAMFNYRKMNGWPGAVPLDQGVKYGV